MPVTSCSRCHHVPPADANFCPSCGHALTGDGREARTAAVHTPPHLAEKILGARATLTGERKRVSVLFADITGSMELLADRDPEDARKLLDPVVDAMMEAVHRYEGTVNQVMGDGIMALFGAPVAHEDHAVRACYAALRMQHTVQRLSDTLRATEGLSLQIRVGVNSGEVVVGSIGNDLHMEYTAVGQTTHLAARMEQIARPGTTLVTAETLREADGLVTVRPLGRVPVRGVAERVEVFELTGVAARRTRLDAAAARGLAPLVGRDVLLARLDALLGGIPDGRGHAVALLGEAGVGKSRLVREWAGSRAGEWRVVQGRAASWGQATPFFPVIDLLRNYFDLDPDEDVERARDRVTRRVLDLDPGLSVALPALQSLLQIAPPDAAWDSLDPPQRRQRTLEALRRLAVSESRGRPLLIVLEDLHWSDSETEALLGRLLDGLAGARVGMLLTDRRESAEGWPRHPHCTTLLVEPLPAAGAQALLDTLLGPDQALTGLKRLLAEQTLGNPFFLEECVRALAESRVLEGRPGGYRLAGAAPDIRVPPAVHAVLAARIDRLAPEDKRLLQCAAAIGHEVPHELLAAVADLPEDALRAALDRLHAGQLLVPAQLFSHVEYVFRHALTHEVAYEGLLHEQRRALHARIGAAMERLYADRMAEHAERLALHALRGERWDRALVHLREAAAKAAHRSAHRQAAAHLRHALEALRHLAADRAAVEQAIDLRLELRNALFIAGELEPGFEPLREADRAALQLGDVRRLVRIRAALANSLWAVGDHEAAVEAGRAAHDLARQAGDVALEAIADQYLGQAYHALGDYPRAVAALRRAVASLQGDLVRRRVGMPSLPAVFARTWLVWCLGEHGGLEEAARCAREAFQIAGASEQLYTQAQAQVATGIVALHHLDIDRAISALEHARTLCQEGNLPLTLAMTDIHLGRAYGVGGRIAEAVALLDRSRAECAAMRFSFCHLLAVIWSGHAHLDAGRVPEAAALAEEARAMARAQRARGLGARALRLLGDARAAGGADEPGAVAAYRQAIALAERLEMRPLVGRTALALGSLYRRAGRAAEARQAFTRSADVFAATGMDRWLERARSEVGSVA